MTEKWESVTSLLPAGQRLLVSCFDAHHTTGGGLFSLGESVEEIDRISSTGLCYEDGRLLRCLWSDDGSPAELIVYDATGVLRYHRLDEVSTPHDILAAGRATVVVATTQNEVRWVGPDGEVERRWQAPGEVDSWHLNGVGRYEDHVVVSAFGRYDRRRGWDAAGRPASGCVVDVDTGERLIDGLNAPHNPCYADGTWLICNSAAGELVELPDSSREITRRLPLPGWPRGLVVTDDHLFVGLSPHRHAKSSLQTATVAIVDRSAWELVATVDLPAREIYALALVPEPVVAGAHRGFTANSTREHEQSQRLMFDQLGIRPRRLWAVGDPLSPDEQSVVIEAARPETGDVETGALIAVDCQIRNTGTGILTPAPPYPVRVVHRWYDAKGDLVATEPISTSLGRSVPPESTAKVLVRARVPSVPGDYRLRLTLAQDGARPFDESNEACAADVPLRVLPGGTASGSLGRFGIYPGEVRDAFGANGASGDVVRALITRPSGSLKGLVIGLIEDLGEREFASAAATALGLPEATVAEVVRTALAGRGDALLTGSEATALALRRTGAKVAFTYAGTSELGLCDALARLGLLVNGRGDTEALFQAAGASRLNPGTGVAILHAARGLTNALGALAGSRRNEIGTVVVVGMPSTGSAPFLPPHAEPELIATSGRFAKGWHEIGPVPGDPDERAAAVRGFVAAIRDSIEGCRQAPRGPMLFGLPQDVAEAEWIPLAALDGIDAPTSTAVDRDALDRASRALAPVRRVVVLVDDYALTHEGMAAAIGRFSGRLNAPVLQVKYRRGPMLFERLDRTDVPGFLGWYDPADLRHRAVLGAADLVVTIEDRNMYPRVIGHLPPCPKIALTSHPSATAKNGYLGPDDVVIEADPVASLDVLTDSAGDTAHGDWCPRWETRRGRDIPVPQAAAAIRTGIARAIAGSVGDLPGGAVLVDDSQMFGGLLAEEYDVLPRGLRVFGDHGGFVGGGIANATGLALGEPSVKVICTLGDQGFTNGIQGLVAAVQESAPVTFLVCNNGGSASLRKQSAHSVLLDDGRHHYLDNATSLRYKEAAATFGLESWRVDFTGSPEETADRLAELRRTLAAALSVAGPTLVELVLPAEEEFWSGVWITQGFEQSGGLGTNSAFLFDLDGVLVDSKESIERAWRRWADSHGLPWESVSSHIPGRLAVDTIREVLPDLDETLVQREADQVNQAQVEDGDLIRPIAGMPEAVEEAASQGVPWGVVTACPRALALARLRAAGYPVPKVLITAEDVDEGKPSPKGYLLAADGLSIPIENCVIVEDSPSGVAAGRAAGAVVVGLSAEDRSPGADLASADVVIPDGRALSVAYTSGINGA